VNRVIVLYVDGYFVNQWDATCMVALEEKQVPFTTARGLLRDGGGVPVALAEKTHIARVPALQHGDLWLTESSAIVEYLEEQFPEPRLFPADPFARAKARQWMAFVRADLTALRSEVSWWRCVYPAAEPPRISRAAEREAKDLIGLVAHLIAANELAEWNISHTDLALTLLRVTQTDVELPAEVRGFLDAALARPSVRNYLDHPRPPHKPASAHDRG